MTPRIPSPTTCERAGGAGRAVDEWLGVSVAARICAAGALGQCPVGLRGAAVERDKRAVDDVEVPAALAGRVVEVCPRDDT